MARSVVREMSIGGKDMKYNSPPLRHFEVFERHNLWQLEAILGRKLTEHPAAKQKVA
jgi:hypothetical protein